VLDALEKDDKAFLIQVITSDASNAMAHCALRMESQGSLDRFIRIHMNRHGFIDYYLWMAQ
jgi:hypothetical protein